MSNLKNRLDKLEASAPVNLLPELSPEEYEQMMERIQAKLDAARDAIRDKPREPWVITPIPANASPTIALLHSIQNRMAGG
jgi:hypothetical protein